MNGLNKIFRLLTGQLKASLVNVRVWLGYVVGIVVALKTAHNYCGYASGRVIQIFEPYLENYISFGDVTLMLIGYILIISDAPFINRRSTLALYRTSRGQWFWGMSLYMIVHCVFYYIAAGLASCLYVMGIAYPHDLWSIPMQNLARYPSLEAVEYWHLNFPEEPLIINYTPWQAMALTLLMMAMYSIILALILLIFNTLWNRAAGAALAAGIHILGYIMAYDGFSGWFYQWSLLYSSRFIPIASAGDSPLSPLLLLALYFCALLFVGSPLLKKADFDRHTGERDE